MLIVVIGVFLGLQAQEWNQQRLDRDQERANIERLTADFSTIQRDLQRCLTVYRDSINAISQVAGIVDSGATGPEDMGFADVLVRMTAGEIPAGRSSTFVEILATGELGVLRDTTLREALLAYDQRAQINREIWRSMQSEMSGYRHPFYNNISVQVQLDDKQISSISDYDFDGMSRDPRFRAMLNVLAGTKGNIYELCRTQLGRAEQVHQLLIAENQKH